MSVSEKVSRFIRRHAMLDGAHGIVIAVSGGPDSVTLLDMLARLLSRSAAGEEPGVRFCVAHLNHMLRGCESDDDAEFVRQMAVRMGLSVVIESADVAAAAKRAGRGIEEMAREIRYAFLRRVARESGCDRIATGHTMNDQAETFLMRLARGSGLRGLSAMRPVIPAHMFDARGEEKAEGERPNAGYADSALALHPNASVLLIRPLLSITRDEVHGYCLERALAFRSDSTNMSLNLTRNRVRGEVLPALRAINPRIVESIARAAENAAGDEDVLQGLASSLLVKARILSDARLVDRGTSAYSVAALLDQPRAMRRRMILEAIRLVSNISTSEEQDDAGEVSSTHVAAVEALLERKTSGKHINLPNSLEVWRDFDALVLKLGSRSGEATYESAITSACPDTQAGGFAFTIERARPIELLASVIEETLCEKQHTGRDWMTVALDEHALPERLVIRPRSRGERSRVIGKRQTIKLKNLMIDHRIPSSRRAAWPLVATPDGRYVWSPGLPPALEFAAHDETRSLAIMRASAI